MLFRHSMSIAQELMPIYNTTVHKNKINVALNLMWLTVGCYETSNRPQGQHKEKKLFKRTFCTCEPIFFPNWLKINGMIRKILIRENFKKLNFVAVILDFRLPSWITNGYFLTLYSIHGNDHLYQFWCFYHKVNDRYTNWPD